MAQEADTGVVVLAKLPRSGNAKTRLAGTLTSRQRATLQAALLRDALTKARRVGKTYLAFCPPDALDEARRYEPSSCFPQSGADLGERMANALGEVLQRGHGAALLIGTDCPYLTHQELRRAAGLLRHGDVCLGPAMDGGYYMIGMRRLHRGVFDAVPWSSPATLKITIECLSSLGLTYSLTQPLPDIDTPQDLDTLIESVDGHGHWRTCSPELRELVRGWRLRPTTVASGPGPRL